jgi:hypothetical protein
MKRPSRACCAHALVIAIVALAALISPSVASAQFDFALSTAGPENVVRGQPLYFALIGRMLSGTSPTLLPITVSGLPVGATVTFPDIVRTCCGTNQVWSFDFTTTIQVNTLLTTPVGPAALTVTVTAGGVSRTVSYPFTVTPPPNQLSFTPYTTATDAPQRALWESNMTRYGATFCAQLTDPSLSGDQKLALTYYDSQRVFYSIRDYTSASSWDACALNAQAVYRDAFVIPNNGGVSGYWDFPHGIYQSYVRRGDAASANAVRLLSQNAAFGTAGRELYGMIPASVSREVAYHLMAYLLARATGEPVSAIGEAYLDLALGHVDQWFVSKSFRCPSNCDQSAAAGKYYIQPFMVGLTAEALIQYYETQSQDARIPSAVKTAMDWLWANAWVPANQSFWYENWVASPSQPLPASPGVPDLNLLIAPAYAWLYKQTGDTTYRNRADAIFASGVTQAWVSGDGKHFNQQYRWSFDYLKWRNPAALPAPTGLSVR